MNRNILLIYPKYTYPRKNPPLGLAYLASFIRQYGFVPQILDLNVENVSDTELANKVVATRPLAVGISFMTNQYGEALKVAKLVKSASPVTHIIAGGPHVSALPEETLRECKLFDSIVVGEGECTFAELLSELQKEKQNFKGVNGLCFRDGENIIRNEKRDMIGDIDSTPYAAWDLLRLDKYSVFSVSHKKTFAIISSRGCPNQCIFCDSHTIFGRKFRGRSTKNIFNEIMFLHKNYDMESFDFVDDLITVDKERVLELCDLIKNSGIGFRWMANARVNTIDREMLRAMRDAGCVRIDVGVESGDPNVRKIAHKGITNQQIINAHKIAKELGIQIGTFTMVGNLGETKESVKMTIDLLKDICDDVMVAIACPFPGTELYRIALKNDYLKIKDWSRFVTSPTYLKNYQPVMITDKMNQKEILNAFYRLHRAFVIRKIRARYGKYFFVNPRFIKNALTHLKFCQRLFCNCEN